MAWGKLWGFSQIKIVSGIPFYMKKHIRKQKDKESSLAFSAN
jgi:hypothetical protein